MIEQSVDLWSHAISRHLRMYLMETSELQNSNCVFIFSEYYLCRIFSIYVQYLTFCVIICYSLLTGSQ